MTEIDLKRLERLEDDATAAFTKMVGEEHFLKMELSEAVGSRDLDSVEALETKLKAVTQERIRLHGQYLEAKLNTAKGIKANMFQMYGIKEPVLFEGILAPIFDKDIWEVEDAIDRYKRTYMEPGLREAHH